MYKRMLVPLDGSELAESAYAYVKELAARLHLEVTLLHVYTPAEEHLASMHRAYVERMADRLKHESEGARQTAGVAASGKGIGVKAALVGGYAPEEILRYAGENKVDLILMATHGRSGVGRWAFGSVADKVLRASPVPVWLVRAGAPQEVVYDRWLTRTILVPLDGSELADSVLPYVKDLAKQLSRELVQVVLLRVCAPPAIPVGAPDDILLGWDERVKQEMGWCQRIARQDLARAAKPLRASRIRVRTETAHGKPAEEIIDYADRNQFNLIAMATHGRSGMSRWAYGSVADKVLSGASTPVFVVRPQAPASAARRKGK